MVVVVGYQNTLFIIKLSGTIPALSGIAITVAVGGVTARHEKKKAKKIPRIKQDLNLDPLCGSRVFYHRATLVFIFFFIPDFYTCSHWLHT
uniref:Uncharacterized protein n=1 Tax=Rhipicephalus zambeziensis TaxID=60191 RepID=A0A224YFS7_9ACAR